MASLAAEAGATDAPPPQTTDDMAQSPVPASTETGGGEGAPTPAAAAEEAAAESEQPARKKRPPQTVSEKIAEGVAIKDRGNALFKEGNHKKAITTYRCAVIKAGRGA